MQDRAPAHLPHHVRQQLHSGRRLSRQVPGRAPPAALPGAAHTPQRARRRGAGVAAGGALLGALPQLLWHGALRRARALRARLGGRAAARARRCHLRRGLPAAGGRGEPGLRAHAVLPVGGRGSRGRGGGRGAQTGDGPRGASHAGGGGSLRAVLGPAPRAHPLLLVRPLRLQPGHLRLPPGLSLPRLRQLLPQSASLLARFAPLPRALPPPLALRPPPPPPPPCSSRPPSCPASVFGARRLHRRRQASRLEYGTQKGCPARWRDRTSSVCPGSAINPASLDSAGPLSSSLGGTVSPRSRLEGLAPPQSRGRVAAPVQRTPGWLNLVYPTRQQCPKAGSLSPYPKPVWQENSPFTQPAPSRPCFLLLPLTVPFCSQVIT